MNNSQSRAATVAPSAADSQHEAAKEALRTDLETGKCGVLGAVVLHPELTLLDIVAVAGALTKERNGK